MGARSVALPIAASLGSVTHSLRLRSARQGRDGTPTTPALLGNPLDFIHEDHLREREICAQLDTLAGAETPDPETAACILSFLRVELPLHLKDEEEDLFPLVRRRCAPEDEIGKAIDRLASDHRHAGEDTPQVIADLESLNAPDRKPSEEMHARFASFATHARRHLILENAIILPFARLRLTQHDLKTLSLRMMQRRGLDQNMETSDAE